MDNELRPGERVLWLGQPQGSLLTGDDAVLIPVSLAWLGFFVFSAAVVLINGGPDPFGLVLVPFLAIGLYVAVGRFLVKARGRRKTLYALTDQRVIVKSGKMVRTLFVDRLPMLEVSSSGGRGKIIFGHLAGVQSKYANTRLDWVTHGNMPMAFFDISDPQNAARIFEDAAKDARSGEIEHSTQQVVPTGNDSP